MENTINKEKNTKLIYGIGGLIIGGLLVCLFLNCSDNYKMVNNYTGGMSHMMPDGTMMSNTGMDMDSMMNGMMEGLKGKKGDDFDKAFIEEMVIHHQGAVVMAEEVLKNSKRPELIKLANDIISAQTKEIVMMNTWKDSWFK